MDHCSSLLLWVIASMFVFIRVGWEFWLACFWVHRQRWSIVVTEMSLKDVKLQVSGKGLTKPILILFRYLPTLSIYQISRSLMTDLDAAVPTMNEN